MVALEKVATRVAARIERERAGADDWRTAAILDAECDAAGVSSDEARAQVGALAEQQLLQEVAP